MAARTWTATWRKTLGWEEGGAGKRASIARGLWCYCALLSAALLMIYAVCRSTREAGRWVSSRSRQFTEHPFIASSADRADFPRSAGDFTGPETYAGAALTGHAEAGGTKEPFNQTEALQGTEEWSGRELDCKDTPCTLPLPKQDGEGGDLIDAGKQSKREEQRFAKSPSAIGKTGGEKRKRNGAETGASQVGHSLPELKGSAVKIQQINGLKTRDPKMAHSFEHRSQSVNSEAGAHENDDQATRSSRPGTSADVPSKTVGTNVELHENDGRKTGASHLGPPRVAFMFISRGVIPTDRIWDRFFSGAASEDLYSVYIHCHQGPGFKYNASTTAARAFYARALPDSGPVERFHISLLDAALHDAANQWFVLLSDSCVSLRSFAYTYDYLLAGNKSFVDARWTKNEWNWKKAMLPDIPRADFKTGSQWSAVTRPHAALLAREQRYYAAFARAGRTSPDEHYPPTVLPLLDPLGFDDRTLTHVDWSVKQKGGSPRSYTPNQIKRELLARIASAAGSPRPIFFPRNPPEPCLVGGRAAPCYLFARKFPKDTVEKLLELLPIEGLD
ncbi:hypothetical protein KFL_000030520 [Klebsormidium nitens]|uniref:Core-2/I-branching beta-1,6-N-acetylglucosaminyltransferase family protein n=1 Tax=Klebsormidium nitens TaxID=105231 RepID=A0A1Y1HH62_KLENI|nr:hypothetical protein KFL_000030520 [Klebsormidium nitens]|eukprot:GAQ77775.1 hypothetical protein KFL_000030520 [Klebsormidium nitens]